MKITKRQLKRIIRENLANEEHEEIVSLIYAVLEDSMSAPSGGIAGMALVGEVLRMASLDDEIGAWRSNPLTNNDVFSVLDELLEDGEVHFDVEEDVWSLDPGGNQYDYMTGFMS